MIPTIITIVCCCVICFVTYLITARRVKQSKTEWQHNEEEALRWKEQKAEAQEGLNSVLKQRIQAETQVNMLQDTAARLREQANESADAYYEQKMESTKLKLAQDLKIEEEKFQEATKDYEDNYHTVMAEMAEEVKKYGVTANQLIEIIDDMKSKARAAIEASKRKMEEHDAIEFHRIQIPDSDLLEIERLREVIPYLRDKDTLNKVIYKIYYENPVNDLIGRVVGRKQGGIYKITNINNGMCYIGQAVNFANRWKQHIKRGVGAEPITHNKLYPAMQKEGVENFTFEIIEECSPKKLNEREQYWQDFFGAKEFGYSIR